MAKNDLSIINDILNDYATSINEQVNILAEQIAKDGVKELKNTNVPKARTGDYKKGWRVDKSVKSNDFAYTIYNAKKPGLTHLLENGHIGKNQYGQWGKVKGFKHIAPVEKNAINNFEKGIEQIIKKGGK